MGSLILLLLRIFIVDLVKALAEVVANQLGRAKDEVRAHRRRKRGRK